MKYDSPQFKVDSNFKAIAYSLQENGTKVAKFSTRKSNLR